MAYINIIETLTPQNEVKQDDFVELLNNQFLESQQLQRLASISAKRTGIKKRYSVIDLFKSQNNHELNHYIETSLEEKNNLFYENALKLVDQLVNKSKIDFSKITHIISISCTGIKAPGIEIEFIKKYKLNPETIRYSVNFMGCYAAIHGLKLAKEICQNNFQAQVLIVDIELCTIHFTGGNDIEEINSSLLFGDGAAIALISNTNYGFKIENSFSDIYFNGFDEMAWYPTSHFFKMRLSEKIPDLIKEYLESNQSKIFDRLEINKNKKLNALIHPGSLKILQIVENSLSDFNLEMKKSYEVLENFGNMSSVTLFFILERTFKNTNENYLMMGFGPGLSIETLKLC